MSDFSEYPDLEHDHATRYSALILYDSLPMYKWGICLVKNGFCKCNSLIFLLQK
ncbi:Uncharacterized protein dnm_050420 [Desulfonema magnum]|uniref:Uncharacterized protein n=1 Tax=Desulfonema magnum TaxID=45655 RepID=A0A975BPE1_9BACT|nr:Uncharacterized protein dnm_050420 [Desulfonema magnum]